MTHRGHKYSNCRARTLDWICSYHRKIGLKREMEQRTAQSSLKVYCMIVGIGTDLVEIKRMEKAYLRSGFAERVFTEKERELIGACAARAAGNFAVKEAVVKAFGTGFRKVSPQEIEVLRDKAGKPYALLFGQAEKKATELGIDCLHVSISNEREYAIAFVVAEKQKDV